jgi:phosphogluconate dehydratase
MPELHSLSPALSVIQDKGFKVAFVTDGRMSGASGKTPAAIHVSPEALAGGPLAHVKDGDVIRLDAEAGVLTTVGVPDLTARPLPPGPPPTPRARPGAMAVSCSGLPPCGHDGRRGRDGLFRLPDRRPATDTPPDPNFVDRTVDA